MDIPDLTTFKRCQKCGEVKPREAFSVDRRNKRDGLQARCKACVREYYMVNAERIAEQQREYCAANADYIAEWQRKYRQENAEHLAEQHREYYAENAEFLREYRREHYAANAERITKQQREYGRKYRKSHIGKAVLRAASNRYRARKLEVGGTYTQSDLAAIRAAQTDKKGRLICWRCGKPIKGTPDLDHWIPLKHRGENSPGNLHYMHVRCNRSKGAKLPTEIGRLL
jgi:5-methylcytosine-specific restriction endonuclease McrA